MQVLRGARPFLRVDRCRLWCDCEVEDRRAGGGCEDTRARTLQQAAGLSEVGRGRRSLLPALGSARLGTRAVLGHRLRRTAVAWQRRVRSAEFCRRAWELLDTSLLTRDEWLALTSSQPHRAAQPTLPSRHCRTLACSWWDLWLGQDPRKPLQAAAQGSCELGQLHPVVPFVAGSPRSPPSAFLPPAFRVPAVCAPPRSIVLTLATH